MALAASHLDRKRATLLVGICFVPFCSVLSRSKNVPFKKWLEHGTKVGQSVTKRDIFSWTFSIEVNPDSKPDEGLKQPCFSLIGLIDEF